MFWMGFFTKLYGCYEIIIFSSFLKHNAIGFLVKKVGWTNLEYVTLLFISFILVKNYY